MKGWDELRLKGRRYRAGVQLPQGVYVLLKASGHQPEAVGLCAHCPVPSPQHDAQVPFSLRDFYLPHLRGVVGGWADWVGSPGHL